MTFPAEPAASVAPMQRAAGLPLLGAAGVLLTVSLFFGGGSGDERLFWIGMGALLVMLLAAAVTGLPSLPRVGRAEPRPRLRRPRRHRAARRLARAPVGAARRARPRGPPRCRLLLGAR